MKTVTSIIETYGQNLYELLIKHKLMIYRPIKLHTSRDCGSIDFVQSVNCASCMALK